MTSRESNRLRDAEKKRILDDATRNHRARKALEKLEQDNFHDDPHADLVMSKKVPKFEDSLRGTTEKKKRKGPDYYRAKYRKNFAQLLEEEKQSRSLPPNYQSALAPPPTTPGRKFCAVCGDFSKYNCNTCGAHFCCVRCFKTHTDTRCLKWTA